MAMAVDIYMHLYMDAYESTADRCHWVLGGSSAKYAFVKALLKCTEAHRPLRCDWFKNDVCEALRNSSVTLKLIGSAPPNTPRKFGAR